MCLSVITSTNRNFKGVGWKVMVKVKPDQDIYKSPIKERDRRYKPGVWKSSPIYPKINHILGEIEYKQGFHIFKRKKDAEFWRLSASWVVVKVAFRKAHTCGIQEFSIFSSLLAGATGSYSAQVDAEVIVAKEMKIL